MNRHARRKAAASQRREGHVVESSLAHYDPVPGDRLVVLRPLGPQAGQAALIGGKKALEHDDVALLDQAVNGNAVVIGWLSPDRKSIVDEHGKPVGDALTPGDLLIPASEVARMAAKKN